MSRGDGCNSEAVTRISGAGGDAGVGASAEAHAVDIERIAQEACAHARKTIRTGFTQLDNNQRSVLYRQSMLEAVSCLRSTPEALRVSKDKSIEMLRIQNHHRVARYSIGNCAELAVAACLFVKKNYPSISSEICHIGGGDHAFIVLNRHPDTDPLKPKEWNDDAYICDPWANKVYEASSYLVELKNYCCDMATLKGKVEDFDPRSHRLVLSMLPKAGEKSEEEIHAELANFKAKLAIIISAFSGFKSQSKGLSVGLLSSSTAIPKGLAGIFSNLLERLSKHLDEARSKINIKVSNDIVLATATLCDELNSSLSDLRSDCVAYQRNLSIFSKSHHVPGEMRLQIAKAVNGSIKDLNANLADLESLKMI